MLYVDSTNSNKAYLKWGNLELQSMPRDTCNPMCMCLHICNIPSRIKRPPVPISLPTMQLHMPNMNFVVIAATLVTVTVCFHSKSSCLCRQGCMCKLMLMHQFLDQLTLMHQFHTPTEAHRLGYQLSQLGHSR